jgi:hypothetical protein
MPYKRLIALLLALAAITGLVACGGGNNTTSTSTSEGGSETTTAEAEPPTIVVHDEEPVAGVEKLEYSAGEQVEFKVKSNTATKVHVHGYEIEKKVPAGGTVTVSFPGELEGIYEVEVHPAEEQIAELRVNP